LHAGYLRLQTHTENMYYLFLSHYNNGCKKAPQRYAIRALPVLFKITPSYTGNLKKNYNSANGVLRPSVKWRFQSIFYLKNDKQFQGVYLETWK